MRLSPMTRCALILLPLLIFAGRLHARRVATPEGMTQEVNRCLTVVRVATSRRRNTRERQDRVSLASERIGSDVSAAFVRNGDRAKTA